MIKQLTLILCLLNVFRSEIATEFMGREELPVQGPVPLDPDDAPWKKSEESGIRKL